MAAVERPLLLLLLQLTNHVASHTFVKFLRGSAIDIKPCTGCDEGGFHVDVKKARSLVQNILF